MKEKTVSVIMLAAGALSAVCFLAFRETAPLPVATIFKMLPTLLMCASARLGEEDISVKSQIVCFAGSLSIAASDCLLGLMLFSVIKYTIFLYSAVMAMWWTGLLLLMVTAELKKQAVKRKAENGPK